jgi:BASS family bile acid:Na+ symporter
MQILRLPAAALRLTGRHGTLLVAASVFVGLFVPGLAAACKPLLGPVIVILLVLAFLRVEPAALRHHLRRPGLIAAAALWTMLAMPAALGALFVASGIGHRLPGLFLVLVLQISGPGLMSSPAIAALMGLDDALTLASLMVCTALTPLTAGLFAQIYLGTSLISPGPFGLRLLLIIAGSVVAAAVARRIAGRAVIEAQRQAIDGLSVIALFLFAAAAMDGIMVHIRATPWLVVELTFLAFALALGQIALTALVFARSGRAGALAIGLIAGNRNLGLMLAGTGFAVPAMAWLYFALAQFPIYLLPHLLKPLALRLQRKAGGDG